ncbi:MAG: NAD(P)-dependent alcohol dehydrogenase [Methylocystis sp.]|nr:NAD(P)-dependent alcohol dehydrogenase [Methylocystis sp.]MBI3275888.1 NAD(P)-dependent alcohol dehydrogenase [Methylocystis sp.]
MKAIVIDGYGGADRLQLREVPDPQPQADEVLVRVRAAGVNPADWKIREGQVRLFLRLRFPHVLGSDIAGEVAAIGAGVSQFKLGDAVVAFTDPRRGGGYAELAVAKEAAAALKPASLSFAEAASLPIAACTALQALRDLGKLSEGGGVLINGGAGGVGHFAIQIAKALGATTTAACGPANVAFVQSLGADVVIDYSKEDFTRRAERYDVIFDAAGKSSFAACRHLLTPGGTYVSTLPSLDLVLWGGVLWIVGMFGEAKHARPFIARPNGEDLAFLGRLADEGRLRPTVSRTYPLERAREAQGASRTGHTRGKIVLEV